MYRYIVFDRKLILPTGLHLYIMDTDHFELVEEWKSKCDDYYTVVTKNGVYLLTLDSESDHEGFRVRLEREYAWRHDEENEQTEQDARSTGG